jgi:hypothetical protein
VLDIAGGFGPADEFDMGVALEAAPVGLAAGDL